ncbi:MAG: STY4851/ECs_5259 family protein [Proteobacteria bacterium]|nr:STY4851/ECs_5259 family protein [Pseudomonadota bacterium]
MPHTLLEGLQDFLSARKLKQPDSRALCLYRVQEAEFEELARRAREATARDAFTTRTEGFAAVFCLVAAEWWRRNHPGGSWKWDRVFEAAGLPPDLDRPRVYPVVRLGLLYWKRSLLTVGNSNAYLVTLACEGGLPLNLLRQQGTALRTYFRALLAEFQIYGMRGAVPADLAARVSRHLPLSLRQQVVYQLAGSLVKEIWELQATLGETHTPVQDLDRRDPSWRDRLPLVLSDETARTLLNNLVDDASKLARRSGKGVRAGCQLELNGTSWGLRRRVLLPPSLGVPDLQELLGENGDALYRLELYREVLGGEDERLALVTRRSAGEDARFAVEKAAATLLELLGEQALASVRIFAGTGQKRYPAREVPGGAELSALPWVFVDREGDRRALDLVGEGSVRTHHPEVWVAVPTDAEISPDEGATVTPVGQISELGRDVFEVQGGATISAAGHSSRIRPADSREEAFLYGLEGSLFPVDGGCTPVYLGVPRVVSYADTGARRVIPEGELEWRSPGSSLSQLWLDLSERCRGVVELRHAPQGEARFARVVGVVPASSRLELLSGDQDRCGVLRLSCFGEPEVGVEPQPGLHHHVVPPEGDLDVAEVSLAAEGAPPATVRLHLRWKLGMAVAFDIPFPARGMRFVGRDGSLLPAGVSVHIDRLGGVTARVLGVPPGGHYLAEAVLHAEQLQGDHVRQLWARERLSEVAPGRHELDLRTLQEASRALLAMSGELDAWVEIQVLDEHARVQTRTLSVRCYDVDLQCDVEAGHVLLPDYDAVRLDISQLDKVRMVAFPMWNPAQEPEALPTVKPLCWAFHPEQREPGPWLLYGGVGSRCRFRPHCWVVPAQEGDQDDTAEKNDGGPCSLLEAVIKQNPKERSQAIRVCLSELAKRADHPDWQLLDAYLHRLVELPPGTFDVTTSLVKDPRAAAAALLRAGPERFGSVWDTLESLPFSWELVPVSAWVLGAAEHLRVLREALAAVAEALGPETDLDQLARTNFRTFLSEVPLRSPGMALTAELVAYRALGEPLANQQSLPMACGEQGRKILCGPILQAARQELLVTQADSEWPGGGGLEGWLRHQGDVPDEIRALHLEPPPGAGFRAAVLNVPIAAAVSVGFGFRLPEGAVFHVRRCRDFYPRWFNVAYGCVLAASVGWQLEHQKGIFDG